MRSCDIHLKAISQNRPQPSVTKISFKITYLKFNWNLPVANELILPLGTYIRVFCLFQVTEDLDRCKQDMEERGTSMTDGGERERVNSLRQRQNGRHFTDDIFKCIFLNENIWTSLKISLKFVPKGGINNIPSLVQIMAWRQPGDKPLSERIMFSLLMHICVTLPQWVHEIISQSINSLVPSRWGSHFECIIF